MILAEIYFFVAYNEFISVNAIFFLVLNSIVKIFSNFIFKKLTIIRDMFCFFLDILVGCIYINALDACSC